MDETQNELVLNFFRALADIERLKMAGLLSLAPRSAQELAELLKIKLPRVVNHLSMLVHFGLVKQEGTNYLLDGDAVQAMARQALAGSRPSVKAEDLEGPEYDRKVLAAYLNPDGSLKSFPMQQKKLQAVLRHILPVFQPGVRYAEKQVNELLKKFNPDFASLRRYLVDEGMLARAEGQYWRVD